MKYISIDSEVFRLTEKQYQTISHYDVNDDEELDKFMQKVQEIGKQHLILDGRYNY